MTNLALFFWRTGRPEKAIEIQERALEAKRRFLPSTHPYLKVALRSLSVMYEKEGKAAEAEALRSELSKIEAN